MDDGDPLGGFGGSNNNGGSASASAFQSSYHHQSTPSTTLGGVASAPPAPGTFNSSISSINNSSNKPNSNFNNSNPMTSTATASSSFKFMSSDIAAAGSALKSSSRRESMMNANDDHNNEHGSSINLKTLLAGGGGSAAAAAPSTKTRHGSLSFAGGGDDDDADGDGDDDVDDGAGGPVVKNSRTRIIEGRGGVTGGGGGGGGSLAAGGGSGGSFSMNPSQKSRNAQKFTPTLSNSYARLGVWQEVRDGLYDVCRRQILEWPSHVVEWLPDYKTARHCLDFALHYVAVGTQAATSTSAAVSHHTPQVGGGGGGGVNKKGERSSQHLSLDYISILEIALPENAQDVVDYFAEEEDDEDVAAFFDQEAQNQAGNGGRGRGPGGASHLVNYADVRAHCKVEFLLAVDGPVLALRGMPQQSEVLACRTSRSPDVKIFRLSDRPKLSSNPRDHRPDLQLKGATDSGFALAWTPLSNASAGRVAAGSDDNTVAVWDLEGPLAAFDETEDNISSNTHPHYRHTTVPPGTFNASESVTLTHTAAGRREHRMPVERIAPMRGLMTGHEDIVHDVSWHATQDHLLGSAGQDGKLILWDCRVKNAAIAMYNDAHSGGVFCLDFHPSAAFQFCSGGGDGLIQFWDIRKPSVPETTLAYHTAAVTKVQWAPFSATALASAGTDHMVCSWDFGRGAFPTREEHKDAPPCAPSELVFVHPAHIGRVTDMQWCPNVGDEWLMATTDTANSLHLTKPREAITEDRVEVDPFDED